jgi:hypothetical protein
MLKGHTWERPDEGPSYYLSFALSNDLLGINKSTLSELAENDIRPQLTSRPPVLSSPPSSKIKG